MLRSILVRDFGVCFYGRCERFFYNVYGLWVESEVAWGAWGVDTSVSFVLRESIIICGSITTNEISVIPEHAE